ncbi:MAG: hypothetical protein RBR87_16815 [Bacteroidales bacterium]|nr:hypothetical protein [Bacteroidales bacterium]
MLLIIKNGCCKMPVAEGLRMNYCLMLLIIKNGCCKMPVAEGLLLICNSYPEQPLV